MLLLYLWIISEVHSVFFNFSCIGLITKFSVLFQLLFSVSLSWSKKMWVRFNKGQRTNFPILQKAYLRILFLGGDLTKTKIVYYKSLSDSIYNWACFHINDLKINLRLLKTKLLYLIYIKYRPMTLFLNWNIDFLF